MHVFNIRVKFKKRKFVSLSTFCRRQITGIVNPHCKLTILHSTETEWILDTCISWRNLPDVILSKRRGHKRVHPE